MTKVYWSSFDSKIGTIYLASTAKGICKIGIPASTKREFLSWLECRFDAGHIVESTAKNKPAMDQLSRYFDRKLARFSLKVHFVGTPFQIRVWKELKKIGYGRTISYKELARRVGKPGAYQAVGRANSTNPLPILIPCHRVVGVNDDLRGYAAGTKTKEFLLRLEGALLI
ncbi:MAG: methylated-DNA--[protein]-cysteine S-methyltransferase [Ignavibacteria bacterium]|nr:methylated-DNA--[protein]-cysteine S-methyltransferase [Ignavibacteria bacterium]